MKKKTALLLCLLLLCGLWLFTSCGKNRSDQTNVYESIPDYKSTTCDIRKEQNLELHIETAVDCSREELDDLFRIVQADRAQLDNRFHLQTPVRCYVIEDEYILGKDSAVYQSDVLLCNKSAIQSGLYRRALTGAYLRSTEYWKQYGAYACAFGYEYHNEELKGYYADGNDLALTLFPAYFIDAFSTDTDIAVKTACSLADFILENYGFHAFIEANLTAYRAEYLRYLDIERDFRIPLDLTWLDGAEYSQDFLSYPLVIRTENRVYHLDAFPAKRDTARFDTAERVLYHLSRGVTGCNQILEAIRSGAPESEPSLCESYASPLEYFISDRETKTCCDVERRRIYLLDPSEYVHETMHAVTLSGNPTAEAWLGEGVAEYLSRHVSDLISDIDCRFYLSFTDDTLTGPIADFVDAVNALYRSKGGSFETLSSFDLALLEECIGITTLKNENFKTQIRFPYATTPLYKTYACTMQDGNVLTYPEAYAFTKYLIDRYGLDNVLKCCMQYNTKNAFGADYDTLLKDFLDTLP